YMAIYLAMTLGAFAIILGLRRGDAMFDTVDDLSGLARTHPVVAFLLAAMMFSLAGIPPLAGFFAKFYVLAAAIQTGQFALVATAVIGAVLTVVGAFYYIRIVKVMYFDEPRARYAPLTLNLKAVLAVSSAVVLLFWLVPAPLRGVAEAAARSLF
ncbi:MAG TPA: proton-conducting transporter membrane subunit, partial [Microvirga sp.]|nr:proton-conducting transporter membrane subunit [Microvirga sp.]